jgi:probable HAF family extracellular repeat protein
VGQHTTGAQAERLSAVSHLHPHTALSGQIALRELGTLGGAISQAKAVNRLGHVVGTSRDALGRSRAFLWKNGAGIVDLSPFTGVNTSANDINDAGDIVGGGDTGFGDFHAYLLSEGTSFDLGTLGGSASEALALNRSGQVAGHSRVRGGPARHAFFLPEPGRMTDLGTLGGATSVAHDLNDRGEVVGFAETRAGEPHAVLWTAGHGPRDLGTLGRPVSMGLAINNRGAVVGGSGHAFLWTDAAGLVDLGTLGGVTSCANDVNDSGFVVGVSQTAETDRRGQPVTRAFLRIPDGRMLDLGTLGGEHSSAAAISEEVDGALLIVGHSHDDAARVRAVLWMVRLVSAPSAGAPETRPATP